MIEKKSKKIVVYLIIFLFCLFFTTGSVCWHNLKCALNKSCSPTGSKSESEGARLVRSQQPISFLVLGTDVGTDGGFGTNRNRVGLTDSMMVITLDPKKEITNVISIPRDIMTSISGFENTFPQKVNAAYAFKEASDNKASLGSGVGTAISTLQKMFNFPINFYVMVNMSGFADVVDQIDGISVKSPLTFAFSQETAHANGKELYQFTKGTSIFRYAADGKHFSNYSKMNGSAALAFTRMRYQDPKGDYGRTERQRILLNAIINKVKKRPSKLFDSRFINSTSKNIASDLKVDDVMVLGTKYVKATKNIFLYTVQGEGEQYAGVSYQRVTTAQRQAVTNKVRKALNLGPSKTGAEFGGSVGEDEENQVGISDELFPEYNTVKNLDLKLEGKY